MLAQKLHLGAIQVGWTIIVRRLARVGVTELKVALLHF
jgi:hypothetical protein